MSFKSYKAVAPIPVLESYLRKSSIEFDETKAKHNLCESCDAIIEFELGERVRGYFPSEIPRT